MTFTARNIKRIVTGTLFTGALGLALVAVPVTQQTVAAADAAGVFKAKCAGCHGPDGGGNTAPGKSLKVRDLRSGDVRGQGDAALYNVVAHGKGKMPAYEKSLGADTCKQLVAYVKSM